MSPSIFMSYSWSDTSIVDIIDKDFMSIGINIIRDVRDLGYKENIKDYMKKIRETDFSLIIISDSYLKSKNCMYEILEFTKEINYRHKILPILLDDCKIFRPEDKIAYLNYWNEQVQNMRALIKGFDPIKAIPIIDELKAVERISLEISDFLALLSEMKLVTYKESKANEYGDVLKFIGLENDLVKKQLLGLSSIEDTDERDLLIEQLLIKYPDNPDIAFKRAFIELTEKKNGRKAAILWKDYIERFNKESHEAFNNLGLALSSINENKQSEEAYLKALAINPDVHQTYHNLGVLYGMKFNDYQKAVKSFETAISLKPDLAISNYCLANLYQSYEHRYDEAIMLYEKAIQSDPEIIEAYNNLMYLSLIHLKDRNKALNYASLAIEYNPNDAKSYYNLGILYENEFEDYVKAKENYRIAIIKDSNYTPPYVNLSNLEVRVFGNLTRGKELLEDLLARNPNDIEATFNLALLLSSNRATIEKGRELYLKAIEGQPALKRHELDLVFGI